MDVAALENITRQAENLSLDEQLILVEKLAQNLRRRVLRSSRIKGETQNFYGIWQNDFPSDFDIDATLSEIRGEYKIEPETNP